MTEGGPRNFGEDQGRPLHDLGEWRNGRRAGFGIRWELGSRASSTLVSLTRAAPLHIPGHA
jgi:hypothetical protein